MDYDDILKQVEAALGAAPRSFGLMDRLTWYKQDLPYWDWKNDDIHPSVDYWKRVFAHGRLTWGHLVQANNLMYEKSDVNYPGEVLIWHDRSQPFDFHMCTYAARTLYALKGTSSELTDEEERVFAQNLEGEMHRSYGVPVPARIAQGVDLRTSTIFFQRRHIPNKVITAPLFPLLYLEEGPMVPVMVPHKFWPKEFLAVW